MRKNPRLLRMVLPALALLGTPAFSSNVWTGTTGDWFDGANWDTGVPPTAANQVLISNDGTAQISSGNAVSSTLRVATSAGFSGGLEMTGGSLDLGGTPANIGERGAGTVSLSGGATIVGSTSVNVGALVGATGEVTVSGAGTSWTSDNFWWVGSQAPGSLEILDGATVFSTSVTVPSVRNFQVANEAGASGSTVLVDGPGSMLNTTMGGLAVGLFGAGELTIQNEGLVLVGNGALNINFDGGTIDSFVNLKDSGSRLALRTGNDQSADLDTFLASVNAAEGGNSNGLIRYWNGSAFDDIANATLGVDYTLEYFEAGELAGANVLTLIDGGVITGDYDTSGQVEQGDLDIVLQNWGTGTFTGDEAALVGGGPFDGTVDQNELDGVLQNWGSTAAPDFAGSAVPEPAVTAVMGTVGLLVLRRRDGWLR